MSSIGDPASTPDSAANQLVDLRPLLLRHLRPRRLTMAFPARRPLLQAF
jgi:hypothetical protein